MSERRRLKAGVEVEVFPSGWGYVDKRWDWGLSPSQVHALTEPIPEEEEEYAPDLQQRIEGLERVLAQTTSEDRLNIAALERRIEALERDSHPPVRIPLGEIEARIEVLEHDASVQRVKIDGLAMEVASLTPGAEQDAPGGDEPRVMSTSGDGIVFNDDMDDIPGGDEPSVEEVLEWLERGVPARWPYDEDATDAAARIIREQREEIEKWMSHYRRVRDALARRDSEVRELRADLVALTSRKVATKEDVERVAKAIEGGVTYLRMARRALIAMGYEIEEGA